MQPEYNGLIPDFNDNLATALYEYYTKYSNRLHLHRKKVGVLTVYLIEHGCDDLVRTMFEGWKTLIYRAMVSPGFPVVSTLYSPSSALYAEIHTAMAISLVVSVVRAEREIPYVPDVPFAWQMANMFPTVQQHYLDMFDDLSQNSMKGYDGETRVDGFSWNAY